MLERITPTSPIGRGHDAVEAEVTRAFLESGFLVDRAPYHATMTPPTVARLQACWSPGARYIRGRHDRLAVHSTRSRVVLFEVKTNPGQRERMGIEALPLLHAMHTQIPTLYVCRHIGQGWDAAFWTNRLPKFSAIFFPTRCDAYEQSHVRSAFTSPRFWEWANPDFVADQAVGGSGDAFVLIKRRAFEACVPDWRAEISRLAETDEAIVEAPQPVEGEDRRPCVVCDDPGCIAPHETEIRWGA